METVCIIPFLNTQLTIPCSCYQKIADTSTNHGYDVITFLSVLEMADHLECQYSIITYWYPELDNDMIAKDGQRQVAMKSTSCATKFYYLFNILISQEFAKLLKSSQYFKHGRHDIR